MTMPETPADALKREIRLYALECFVCQLFAMVYHLTGDAKGSLAKRRATLISQVRRWGLPQLKDPSMSDFASAELEAAVTRLLDMQQAILEAG
jgi:hypothetical protein